MTSFVYDGVNLIGEFEGESTTYRRRYVHGTGVDEPLVWFEGSGLGTPRYVWQNYQGSVVAYSDSSGVVQELYKYGPYGEPKKRVNASIDTDSWSGAPFRYTGQVMLGDARLYYYKARVYDPKHGRFLQTDPIGSDDDLNLYAYTGGDPINATDPTGNGKFSWFVETVKGTWKQIGEKAALSGRKAGKNVEVKGQGAANKAKQIEQKASGRSNTTKHSPHTDGNPKHKGSKQSHHQPKDRSKGEKGKGHTFYGAAGAATAVSGALDNFADDVGTWEDKLPDGASQAERNRAVVQDLLDPTSTIVEGARLLSDGIKFVSPSPGEDD